MFQITDITRATIYVQKPEQMEQVYKTLDDHERLNIVRIKNKLNQGIQN